MYYGNIKYCDIANGLGVRTSLFVSGCTHHCRECFNREAWNFLYGKPYTTDTENEILASCRPDYIAGLTLLGGEPMERDNQRALLPLVKRFKELYPKKDIWCYTGYNYEADIKNAAGKVHCEVTDELLSYIDILVDGEFILEQKDITLKFRGSRNQRILQIQKPGYPELFPVEK